jgi:hypothetical protein
MVIKSTNIKQVEQITSHRNWINLTQQQQTTTCDVRNPDTGFGQAHTCCGGETGWWDHNPPPLITGFGQAHTCCGGETGWWDHNPPPLITGSPKSIHV